MANTRKLIGAAAFTVALAGGGVAGALLGTPGSSGAQESTTSTTVAEDEAVHHGGRHRGEHLEAAATALGITADELRTELEAGKTIAEVAEAQGVDIETVIDALVTDATADLRERITAMVNGDLSFGGGRGPGGGPKLDVVVEALGITGEELRTALQEGQSIADIAEAQGVDVQTVIDALVAAGVPADRAEALVNHEGGFRHRGGPRP
jgi:ferredoxin